MANFLYSTGMRLMECARLRVKDVDFEYEEILIRNGKGAKDRITSCSKAVNRIFTSASFSSSGFIR